MSDRFHRAARDGYAEVLKEATRRDCNAPDEDGLTPTAWAAYEGNLDALRLLVGRGGDPDKCDHYGNTALHCASARGHMSCVSFLVNFGVNIWALDNELHTAKELAAMNNRDEILRYLDTVSSKQEVSDPKQVKKLQEKSQKDAEKRRKEFDKIQKKADKKREQENVRLLKEREKLEKMDEEKPQGRRKSIIDTISRGSISLLNGSRKDSRLIYTNNRNSFSNSTPKFSEMTSGNNKPTRNIARIQQKINKKKIQDENATSDFKVRETEADGKRSVRNLSGLRRDSEIIFVPNASISSTNSGKRGKISDVFDGDGVDTGRNLHRTSSQPDFRFEDTEPNMQHRGSIFSRPGLGTIAFRHSITATLGSIATSGSDGDSARVSSSGGGSASSLSNRNDPDPWEEEDLPSDDESEATPMYLFLAAAGLADFIPTFVQEHIDLEALMLLTEDDLVAMKLPLGPRRKLLKAIEDRRSTLDDPGEVEDSSL